MVAKYVCGSDVDWYVLNVFVCFVCLVCVVRCSVLLVDVVRCGEEIVFGLWSPIMKPCCGHFWFLPVELFLGLGCIWVRHGSDAP